MKILTEFVAFVLSLLAVVFALVFVFGGTIWLTFFLAEKSCLESYSNYKVEWGFFSGCRIEWDGKMTPIDIIIREIN